VLRKSTISSVGILFLLLPSIGPIFGFAEEAQKRDITVRDIIETTTVGQHVDIGSPGKADPAWFSPDGRQFIVLLTNGNLARNTNDTRVLLYRTADALHSPKPEVLATLSSSSEKQAIRGLKWIDNETLAFIGDMVGEPPQVYSLKVTTKRLERLTNESKRIMSFDVSPDGSDVIYAVERRLNTGLEDEQRRQGFLRIAGDQRLVLLMRGDYAHQTFDDELYAQKLGRSPMPVHRVVLFDRPGSISISPDGKHALVLTDLRESDMTDKWTEYNFGADDKYMHSYIDHSSEKFGGTPFEQYELVDLETGTLAPLLDTPFFMHGKAPLAIWKADGRSVLMEDVYLPLNVNDPAEREARKKTRYDVEVNIQNRELRKLSKGELHEQPTTAPPIKVTLEEDANTPEQIKVTDLKTQQMAMLPNLNPQFAGLKFGRVETIQWKVADDYTVAGGLYLPPDFTEGKRYPLVIQTHGYRPEWFTMDGRNFNSGYAARALAAKGIMVLQMYYFPDEKIENDSDRITKDKRFGENPTQAWKQFEARAYEGAIDYLGQRGILDRDRVGIMGFSRTVAYTGYALTHTKYHFAAALAVDGIDTSYFSYLAYAGPGMFDSDHELLNGGGPPWGKSLADWVREASGFNLDKMHTPIRLEEHDSLLGSDPAGGLLSQWEWYMGLLRLNKPVDYIILPNAYHMVAMPHERIISQQGAVDWFRFWLQGYERPNPEDPDQYKLWEHLRELRDADEKTTAGQPAAQTISPN
jgi:dipeptidyl aminopeptidase/acylaminoacyl peptidase